MSHAHTSNSDLIQCPKGEKDREAGALVGEHGFGGGGRIEEANGLDMTKVYYIYKHVYETVEE